MYSKPGVQPWSEENRLPGTEFQIMKAVPESMKNFSDLFH